MKVERLPKEAWRIDPGKVALVVVDMQRAFVDEGGAREAYGAREIVPGINELANMCRGLKIPVVFLRHSSRADLSDIGLLADLRPMPLDNELLNLEGRKGDDFYPRLDVTQRDYVVTKLRYSAFISGSSSLELLLRGLGRDSFMLCGASIEVCILTTAADGMMLGFKVFVISDLSSSVSKGDVRRREILRLLDRNFGKVVDFERVKKQLQALPEKREM